MAFGALTSTTALAATPPPAWSAIVAELHPQMDPAVAHFDREAGRAGPQAADLIRWSAQADVEVDYGGVPSGSLTARLSGPIDAAGVLAERRDRHDVGRRLAFLRKAEHERAFVYGMLELVCRWGYLNAAEPLLRAAADVDELEGPVWRLRSSAARWERDALLDQIEAHAPGVAALLHDAPGFLCRVPPLGPLDAPPDLDDHPSLATVGLEGRQAEQHAAFAAGLGAPEWSLDASLRYGAGPEPWAADVRVSFHVPIRLPGANASADLDVGVGSARASVRISSDPYGGDLDGPVDDHAQLREQAALGLRLASLRAAVASLELAWRERTAGAGFGVWASLSNCFGICAVPQVASPDPGVVTTMLDTLAVGWELARARLEQLQVAAVTPDALAAAVREASVADVRDPDPGMR